MNKQIEGISCKDCLHYEVCMYVNAKAVEFARAENCKLFADKNDYRKSTDGEWVDRYKGQFANPIYVCSVCGKGTLLTPHINELGQMEMVQAFSHFCPNCGAKMKYESEGADDE
jgi:ribosomal protein S27AE